MCLYSSGMWDRKTSTTNTKKEHSNMVKSLWKLFVLRYMRIKSLNVLLWSHTATQWNVMLKKKHTLSDRERLTFLHSVQFRFKSLLERQALKHRGQRKRSNNKETTNWHSFRKTNPKSDPLPLIHSTVCCNWISTVRLSGTFTLDGAYYILGKNLKLINFTYIQHTIYKRKLNADIN